MWHVHRLPPAPPPRAGLAPGVVACSAGVENPFDDVLMANEQLYIPESSTLLVSYSLPSVDTIPRLQEVAYIQSRNEFNEKELSDAQVRKLCDSLVYKIALRTVHELFESNQLGAFDSVVFNGCVTLVDRSTEFTSKACILSIQTMREEFLKINLVHVDPKACFKALNGVGSSKLHSLTPIAPIMEIRREEVVGQLSAIMGEGEVGDGRIASVSYREAGGERIL